MSSSSNIIFQCINVLKLLLDFGSRVCFYLLTSSEWNYYDLTQTTKLMQYDAVNFWTLPECKPVRPLSAPVGVETPVSPSTACRRWPLDSSESLPYESCRSVTGRSCLRGPGELYCSLCRRPDCQIQLDSPRITSCCWCRRCCHLSSRRNRRRRSGSSRYVHRVDPAGPPACVPAVRAIGRSRRRPFGVREGGREGRSWPRAAAARMQPAQSEIRSSRPMVRRMREVIRARIVGRKRAGRHQAPTSSSTTVDYLPP
jgi:hypothetical protein